MRIEREKILVALLLGALAFQILSYMNASSVTVDEGADLSAGYNYWKTGNFNLNPTHPPLARMIQVIPLLVLNPELPTEAQSYKELDWVQFANDFMYVYNDNADEIIFWGRIGALVLSLVLGYFVYSWSKELYGGKAGLFALFLYSFNPTIIAHSGLVMTDLGVTLFVFLAVRQLWTSYNRDENSRDLVKAGILAGCAMISKVSGVLLIPIYFFYYLALKREKQFLKSLFAIFAIAFVTMLAGYGFQLQPLSSVIFNPARYNEIMNLLPENGFIREIFAFLINKMPIPLTDYLKGIYIQTGPDALHGDYAYLLGEHRNFGGFRHYYLVGFLLKEPVALTIFTVMSLLLFKKVRHEKISNEIFLAAPIMMWFTFFSLNHLNAGLRHVMPAYPFLFVFVSKIVNLKGKAYLALIIILGLWYAGSSLSVSPHYLMYFNELAGGPDNGYKYFWGFEDVGQDMKGLKKYMVQNDIDEIKLAKSGPWIPYEAQHRGIKYQELGCNETTGILAVGLEKLVVPKYDPPGCWDWLKDHEPVDKIGYTIFIYDIKAQ